MKRKTHSVLRSRTGASITFALLLFLVCAVVGALVLTAGSAAAGRVSNLAQSDQRYYNVTSAAGLLADELSGKKVTIVRTREITTKTVTEYKVNLAGGAAVSANKIAETSSARYTTKLNERPEVPTELADYPPPPTDPNDGAVFTDLTFLDTIAVKLLLDDVNFNTDEAMNKSMKNCPEQQRGVLRVIHAGSTDADPNVGVADPSSLSVDCLYEVQSDGTIILTLTNSTDISGETYSLRIKLSPSINETESETTETLSSNRDSYTDSGFHETVTTRTTLTKTAEISWTVSGVEKVVSAADASAQPVETGTPIETDSP